MSYTSAFNFKRFLKPILGVLLMFLFVWQTLPQSALAVNNYIDELVFYADTSDSNRLIVRFHVKTTFTQATNDTWSPIQIYADAHAYSYPSYFRPKGSSAPPALLTYTAGYTYYNYVYDGLSHMGNEANAIVQGGVYGTFTTAGYIDAIGSVNYESGDGKPMTPYWRDLTNVYFSEFPTLTITYPADDAEIVESFYIEGSFTQPDPPAYNWLWAMTSPAGVPAQLPTYFYFPLSRATSTTEGDFTIWINNLSADNYDFYLYFLNGYTEETYPAGISNWKISNIKIVNDLPFSLPPWQELPPYEAPEIYEPLNPVDYYAENSGYETSTAFYTNLTNILGPSLLAISQNLSAYSANFTPSNASSTGTQMAQSIILIRSYLSNINSFFGDFPVSQFLVLYLISLILVIVIRLVKGLIQLFKPV